MPVINTDTADSGEKEEEKSPPQAYGRRPPATVEGAEDAVAYINEGSTEKARHEAIRRSPYEHHAVSLVVEKLVDDERR
jgi:hypothetical protein